MYNYDEIFRDATLWCNNYTRWIAKLNSTPNRNKSLSVPTIYRDVQHEMMRNGRWFKWKINLCLQINKILFCQIGASDGGSTPAGSAPAESKKQRDKYIDARCCRNSPISREIEFKRILRTQQKRGNAIASVPRCTLSLPRYIASLPLLSTTEVWRWQKGGRIEAKYLSGEFIRGSA